MFAILLTHDAQLGLAELVHKKYAALWPDHRLVFRIPFNGVAQGSALEYLHGQSNCQLIPSPQPISTSMGALLEGIPDGAWVFWCIDDRFPVWVDHRGLDQISAFLQRPTEPVEEVKLLRWRETCTRDSVAVGRLAFGVQDRGTRQRGFWHHHFIRAGTLRRVFVRPALSEASTIEDVLAPLRDTRGARGRRSRIEREFFRGIALVPERPLCTFGEPLIQGRLTTNGRDQLAHCKCEVPAYAFNHTSRIYSHSGPGPERTHPPGANRGQGPLFDLASYGSRGLRRRPMVSPQAGRDRDVAVRRLDVLLVCASLGGGGRPRVVANLAAGWHDQGRRVGVATFDDRLDRYPLVDGVARARIAVPAGHPIIRVMQRRLRHGLRRWLTELAATHPWARRLLEGRAMGWVVTTYLHRTPLVRSMRDIIRSQDPAIVVCFDPAANIVSLVASQGLACSVVISERNDFARQTLDFPIDTLRKHLYPTASVATVNSHGMLAPMATWMAQERTRFAPNPLVIPSQCRTGPPPPGFAGPCVLIVARLVYQKNHEVLLDAFARLPTELREWRLAVVGAGVRQAALLWRAAALGIAGRVDWYGYTADPYAFYRYADVFALPSRFEGMPNALLEAMSFGVPPIVSDASPGPLELVRDGETGLVVPTDDPDALASAITLLATRPDLRSKMGATARRQVERFEMSQALMAWDTAIGMSRRDIARD